LISRSKLKQAFHAALPIILGYVAIGLPCGILESSIGMDALQAFLVSVLFYSGAGQFMVPNMWIAGSPIASIIASVSLVNTRQILYSASLAPKCEGTGKWKSFLFAATVTDESFGVNMERFDSGDWSVEHATAVNIMSQTSWIVSNVVGVLLGNAIGIPLAIASFAMTSIFICLMVTQKLTLPNIVAILVAMVGVFVCKLIGLGGAAILIGAVLGVVAAMFVPEKSKEDDEKCSR
jgi:4-azaleucine resistance transporter AzlC